jgi:Protein of unknown function (DUF3341)
VKPPIYGVMAEFDTPALLVAAARRAKEKGYRLIHAYSPFAIEGLADALDLPPNRLPLVVLTAGILGALTGYSMQLWIAAVDYPLNIGGRPLNSWPAFIPVTFELTVLFAAIAAFLGLLALNKLPQPYHPVSNVPQFSLASRDRFFLCIEAADPVFDRMATAKFLADLNSLEVSEVEY